jgi:tetratricopeptide (TPR) repeat protein
MAPKLFYLKETGMNSMKFVLVGVAALALPAGSAFAQDLQAETMIKMQGFTQALGVKCEFCHSAERGSGQKEPKRDVARQMIAMTLELNERVRTATGKTAAEATKIECATCHRGVPVPKRLSDIMMDTAAQRGAPAAIEQYRDLREHYYGSAAYDFSETSLLVAGQTIANRNADAAIALLKLNLEFNPKSIRTYLALAFAQTRKLDDAGAIETLERALEIEPENGQVKGRLEQLKSYRPRKVLTPQQQ